MLCWKQFSKVFCQALILSWVHHSKSPHVWGPNMLIIQCFEVASAAEALWSSVTILRPWCTSHVCRESFSVLFSWLPCIFLFIKILHEPWLFLLICLGGQVILIFWRGSPISRPAHRSQYATQIWGIEDKHVCCHVSHCMHILANTPVIQQTPPRRWRAFKDWCQVFKWSCSQGDCTCSRKWGG